jgi:hypothetical protein
LEAHYDNSDTEHEDVGGSADDTVNSDPDGEAGDVTVKSDPDDDSSPPSNSSQITKIVSPLAAFAGLILIAGIWMTRRRRVEDVDDQNENLMKHTREGFDVENATVSGNTYRTGAFTEDDGTLDDSVDVREDNRRNNVSRNHTKEIVGVVNDLEEISINDDGASTTSVSSNSNCSTNSCDGRLIEAARAAMTAEAFQPDKSKIYDSSDKPEWANRTVSESPIEATDDEKSVLHTYLMKEVPPPKSASGSDDDATTKSIPSSLPSIKCDTEESEVSDAEEINAPSLSENKELKPEEETSRNGDNKTPAWMMAKLRPVSENVSIPKKDDFNEFASTGSSDNEPEWMKKFKQMGLEKKE